MKLNNNNNNNNYIGVNVLHQQHVIPLVPLLQSVIKSVILKLISCKVTQKKTKVAFSGRGFHDTTDTH